MPDWKQAIRSQLSDAQLEPTREAEIVEELAQHLEESGGRRQTRLTRSPRSKTR